MATKGKTIFITGGAGFIGTAVAKRLVADNKIVIYDNFHRNSLSGSDLEDHANVRVIKGSVLDLGKLKESIKKSHIVVHMAAIAGIDTVIKSPVTTMKVNMIGTYNLLEATMTLTKVDRVLYFSTSEVFGSYAYKLEEREPTHLRPVGEARWVYATSKLAGEHLIHSYYTELGLPVTSVRPFNIYGPGQVGEGAIHVFIKKAINDQAIEIHGDGDQIRSWCYIDDMVDAILLCLTKDEAIGEIFNIGNPRGTITILSLAEKIKHLANSKSKIAHVPKNYVDVELRVPSIEKAKTVLGFKPKVDLEEGIKRTIEWYRRNRK
ncbi:MAG: epimerase [candidate division Zixibacteria bacterium SM23_81]|nr:MAG: epimerase [candidate division Zixibacteria bacterium SM23_81]